MKLLIVDDEMLTRNGLVLATMSSDEFKKGKKITLLR